MARQGTCTHFKGYETLCGKGFDVLEKAGGEAEGRAMRIPCVKLPPDRLTPSQSAHWNARSSCSEYEEPQIG